MTDSDEGVFVVLTAAAATMAAGYALDVAGQSIHFPILAGVAVAAMALVVWTSPRHGGPRAGTILQSAVALAVCAYALWLASPECLPVTNGPDVVHHLQLIHAISATGRLPHDPAQYPYLLEMMNYTPGSHVLAAAIGAWLRVDPLRVVYPLAAGFVATKAAIVYALARRVLGTTTSAAVQALAAPVLALVPVYFLGSFVQFFFFAQVVSETFAMGMLLALVDWQATSNRRSLWLASACGVGVVLSWPVWIVPAGVTAVVVTLFASRTWSARVRGLAIALGPAAVLGLVHQGLHRDAASIMTSAGAVTAPSIPAFGLGFLIATAAGVAVGVRDQAARPVIVFLGATVLSSGALAALGLRAGSGSFYMPFKMMYLAILPAAVLGAVALARASDLVARAPSLAASVNAPARSAGATSEGGRVRRAAIRAVIGAMLPLITAGLLVRGRAPARRVHGSLSTSARDVAVWARDRLPPACLDYFSRDWLTGYWLHLDVLGNPRLSDRMRQETFDFPDVVGKWIEGRGLPWAFVEDLDAIPRDARVEMDPVYRAGRAAIVRNRRPVPCADPSRPIRIAR